MSKHKVSENDYIDPTYKKLMKKKSGRKLIQILRLLAIDVLTVKEIQEKTKFSTSEIRKLINKEQNEKNPHLEVFTRSGDFQKRPGRKSSVKEVLSKTKAKGGGRPEQYISISGNGKWLMRFDPEVRDVWTKAEKNYLDIPNPTLFDSYLNLKFRLSQSPILKEFRNLTTSFVFGGYPLHMQIIKPFLFVPERLDEKSVQSYDELVKVLQEEVLPKHVVNYYRAIESSLSSLSKAVEKHKILLEKMRQIPEVREYLINKKL